MRKPLGFLVKSIFLCTPGNFVLSHCWVDVASLCKTLGLQDVFRGFAVGVEHILACMRLQLVSRCLGIEPCPSWKASAFWTGLRAVVGVLAFQQLCANVNWHSLQTVPAGAGGLGDPPFFVIQADGPDGDFFNDCVFDVCRGGEALANSCQMLGAL